MVSSNYDNFCGGFSKIWDSVAEADKHRSDLRIIPENCQPKMTDIKT